MVPDWTIEILSPEQSRTKLTKNILYCLQNQVQMGWLIDPHEQSVFVYWPNRLPEVFDEEEGVLPVPVFARGLQLRVGDLFGWLIK